MSSIGPTIVYIVVLIVCGQFGFDAYEGAIAGLLVGLASIPIFAVIELNNE